jgi:cytokinin dehydrogenase
MARCLVFMLPFLISSFISTAGLPVDPLTQLLQFGGDVAGGRLSVDPSDVHAASRDFGGMSRAEPMAVFRPRGAGDVAGLVRGAYKSAGGLRVSARGHGHSISGQAQAPGGVVVDMSPHGYGAASARERALPVYSPALSGHYVDVWGGELWVDVLNWTLAHGGLAPRSWTDYLYLSVGGTLSNAGISGQAFNHGPQISNVYELDVITGKGDVVTCSETTNPDLFFGALGGLGQFGIITRARIALERAPKRVGTDHCTPFPSSDRFLSFAGNKHDSVFFPPHLKLTVRPSSVESVARDASCRSKGPCGLISFPCGITFPFSRVSCGNRGGVRHRPRFPSGRASPDAPPAVHVETSESA